MSLKLGCKECARSKADAHDPDNPICVICKRRPSTSRPDNYITEESFRNNVLRLLYGRA